MSILSDFEDRVSKAFEGVAGTLFKSPVEPVQIAKAAEKEMNRNKLVSLGKAYAPTLYTVMLSPQDDANLNGFYPTLSSEFATYLTGKANEADLYFAARPLVRFMVDEHLKTGKFDVIAESVSAPELEDLRAEEEEFWAENSPQQGAGSPEVLRVPAVAPGAPIPPPVAHPPQPVYDPAIEPQGTAVVTHDMHEEAVGPASIVDLQTGQSYPLTGGRVVIGREASADIVLGDVNVSRAHAEFIPEGAGWVICDLGSTNGTLVNDQPIQSMRLVDGDSIVVGVTRLEYREG